jgi:hypothetical protein
MLDVKLCDDGGGNLSTLFCVISGFRRHVLVHDIYGQRRVKSPPRSADLIFRLVLSDLRICVNYLRLLLNFSLVLYTTFYLASHYV